MPNRSIRSKKQRSETKPAWRRGLTCALWAGVAGCSLLAVAEQSAIPYVEVVPDVIHDDQPSVDTETPFDRPPDRLEEIDFPQIEPDRFSDPRSDPKTLYRDMGDGFDAEPMVMIEPGADPDNVMPAPTVVAFDSYAADQTAVVEPGLIEIPELAREDRIFQQLGRGSQAKSKAEQAADRSSARQERRQRILLPIGSE